MLLSIVNGEWSIENHRLDNRLVLIIAGIRITTKSNQAFSPDLAKTDTNHGKAQIQSRSREMDTLRHCIFNAYEISSITLEKKKTKKRQKKERKKSKKAKKRKKEDEKYYIC